MTDKQYKVIEILNSKELIINYGSRQGAKKGIDVKKERYNDRFQKNRK